MYVTSLHPSFDYGYFYSIQFTFLRPSKAVENRRKAQWVLALTQEAVCAGVGVGLEASRISQYLHALFCYMSM